MCLTHRRKSRGTESRKPFSPAYTMYISDMEASTHHPKTPTRCGKFSCSTLHMQLSICIGIFRYLSIYFFTRDWCMPVRIDTCILHDDRCLATKPWYIERSFAVLTTWYVGVYSTCVWRPLCVRLHLWCTCTFTSGVHVPSSRVYMHLHHGCTCTFFSGVHGPLSRV